MKYISNKQFIILITVLNMLIAVTAFNAGMLLGTAKTTKRFTNLAPRVESLESAVKELRTVLQAP